MRLGFLGVPHAMAARLLAIDPGETRLATVGRNANGRPTWHGRLDLLVIGPDAEAPLRSAQAVHRQDARTQVLLIVDDAAADDLRDRLWYAPSVGRHFRVRPASDVAWASQWFSDELTRCKQRQELDIKERRSRELLERANQLV